MAQVFNTQNDELYDYLTTHDSITQMTALRELGIMRLASRVSDLRKRGIVIKTEMISVKAKNGKYASVAKYSLVKEASNG